MVPYFCTLENDEHVTVTGIDMNPIPELENLLSDWQAAPQDLKKKSIAGKILETVQTLLASREKTKIPLEFGSCAGVDCG